MFGEIAVDGGLQVDDRMKTAATDALASQNGEEALDRVQPRFRGRREIERRANEGRKLRDSQRGLGQCYCWRHDIKWSSNL